MRNQLQTVANAENRWALCEKFRREYGRIDSRAALLVHAARTARNDQSFAAREFGSRRIAGPNLGVNSEIPNLARD